MFRRKTTLRNSLTPKGSFMRFLLNSLFITLVYVAFQACGSVPQQTVSHINDGGDRFGSSETNLPFDQQSEQTSQVGFSQPEEKEESEEQKFDQENTMNIGIIFMPLPYQGGFSITDRALRTCEVFYDSPCTHLFIQSGRLNRFPAAPVSYSDE